MGRLADTKLLCLIVLLLTAPLSAGAQWMPPDKNDRAATSRVYGKILADQKAGRYEDALVKCVWYFDHGDLPSAMSFGLGAWHELTIVYPPALDKLKFVRDELRRQLLSGSAKDLNDLFVKYTAIQRTISPGTADADTAQAFAAVDKQNVKTAIKCFPRAIVPLLRTKEYALCKRYLDPTRQYKSYARRFELARAGAGQLRRQAEHDVTILVTALVLCGMKDEAAEIAAAAKKDFGNEEFNATIGHSLAGKIPSDGW